MKTSMFLVLILAVIMVVGCAAFKETVKEIKADPGAFAAEAGEITTAVNNVSPIHTGMAGVAAGYLIAFARRMYVNNKKEKATELAKLKGTTSG